LLLKVRQQYKWTFAKMMKADKNIKFLIQEICFDVNSRQQSQKSYTNKQKVKQS
jgi:hypothetical protein